MTSLGLFRRYALVPLKGTYTRPCASQSCSLSVLSLANATASCSYTTFNTSSLSRPLQLSYDKPNVNHRTSSILNSTPRRFYSSPRYPWYRKKDWKSILQKGGLVLLGTGALVASTSLAFGLVIAGAAGFGVYTLYQRVFRPYRSRFQSSDDPFSNVSSNLDTLNDLFRRSRRHDDKSTAMQDDLSSLMQGMPLVVRGFVKTMFSFVGKTMQSSMQRAGELRRRTNEHLQLNKRVREQMGDDVSVGGPEQWMEATTNGVGSIKAVFPVHGTYNYAQVTVKASVGQRGSLNLTELKYRNLQTGDTIDLLRDSSVGGRKKTVIDAEFVDLDDENGRSRW